MNSLSSRRRMAVMLAGCALVGSGVLTAAPAGAATLSPAPAAVLAVGPQWGTVITEQDDLIIRAWPSTRADDIGSLPSGDRIRLSCKTPGGTFTIDGVSGGNQFWYKLAGRDGYVTAHYVKIDIDRLRDLPDCPRQ
ncbi:SH3 domain-containing protein [Streptomyces sp. NPDC088729]|uniref:SH3 domain-containing protein n=1 Tax=Streptomyces sp. NPDC088729 TaxID=3365876 RepID=UPI0038073BD6